MRSADIEGMDGAVASLSLAQGLEAAGFSFDGQGDQIGDAFLTQEDEDGLAGKAFIELGSPEAQPDALRLG